MRKHIHPPEHYQDLSEQCYEMARMDMDHAEDFPIGHPQRMLELQAAHDWQITAAKHSRTARQIMGIE